MSLRRRTVRRLMVLLAAVLVMVGTCAALYLRNEQKKSARMADARAADLKAYKAGDYRAALESLKFYVSRNKTDPEALYAYGISRARIEEPNGKNVFEGIAVLSSLIQLDPGNLDAKYSLLDLYLRIPYNDEALGLAEKILGEKPDDLRAMRAKCLTLERLHRYDDALAVSEKINELAPTDLDQQFVTYKLMNVLHRTPADMLARAQRQQAAHPDDPRFAMVLGMAYGNAGDIATGRQWLSRAATQPSPDASFVRNMVRVFDSLRMYRDAQDLLDRAVASNPDPLVMRVLVQRLWQSGRRQQVIERLKDLDPTSDKSDCGLLAYRALALQELNKVDEANQIITALAKRSMENEALAWSAALSARALANHDPKAALAQFQSALTRSPDNAVIRSFVGDAYGRLGETDLAIGAWRRAAELSPSWAGPRMSAARALAADGRLKEALDEAQKAYSAAPDNSAAAILLANVRYKALEQDVIDSSTEPNLLAAVEQIQKLMPGEPETLPTYVNLLARAGRRDDAIAAALTVVDSPKKYDQTTILRLLSASRTHKLGLEEQLKSAGVADASSPRLVLARAAELAASGKPADGLALLQDHVKSATTRPAQWQLALVQYKEMIHEPDVAKEWVALADANANDLAVQTAVLKNARSVRGDRDFILRTIERLKTLTGPEGQTWKIERARWLLGSDSPKDAAEAVNTLTQIVHDSPALSEARLLLSSAYENVGNGAAAVKELQAAAELEPGNASVALELSRLLQEQNRFADARTYLERAAANASDLPADTRRRIAGMLAAQGDLARGVKVLESNRAELDTTAQLLLAELQRRQGRGNDAEALYVKLLSTPPLTLDTIRAAADFYAAGGKFEQAQKILDRIPETKPRPGAAELVMATFNERYVSAEAARKSFTAATIAAPSSPAVWRQLVGFDLRGGRYDDAAKAAEQGLTNVPDDAVLKRLRTAATSAAAMLAKNPSWRPMLAVLASAVADDPGASEFFKSAQDPTSQPTNETMPARLAEAATRFPRSLALRNALVQWHVTRREKAEAGKVAQATMDAFPSDAESARVATIVYRDAGQWDLAAAAAQKWRQRAPDNPTSADFMLADIRLSAGDPAAALKVLAPYSATMLASPAPGKASMLTIFLRAKALSGKEGDSRAVLEPLIARNGAEGDDGRVWRAIWMQIAGSDLKNAVTSAEWLRHLADKVPANHPDEKIELARAWYTLAMRNRAAASDEGALDEAIKLLDPMTSGPNPAVAAILLRGAVADRSEDFRTAEDCYRRGLVQSPDQPDALNNLAYLILLRGGDLNEANQLISRAIELAPGTAGFFDTQARIQARMGRRDNALATFDKALKLEPNNLEALIGMATTLCDAGRRDSAVGLMAQIDALMKTRPPITPQLRKELEALRTTIKASL